MPASERRDQRRWAGRWAGLRLALGDAPETAGQVAFLELDDLGSREAAADPIDKGPIEEVHDEAAVVVSVVAPIDACAEVPVADVAHRVDVEAGGPQHAANFLCQAFNLFGRKRHVEQHVRVDRIEARVGERERLTHVVDDDAQTVALDRKCAKRVAFVVEPCDPEPP